MLKPTYIFSKDVYRELDRARKKHKKLNSLHEGFGVLLEEIDEFWNEVKKQPKNRNKQRTYHELSQIAAVAQRIAEDLLIKN